MKKIFTLMSMALMVLALGFSQNAKAQDKYVVAGSTAMLGSNWNGNDGNNLMTEQADGTYKLVKSSVGIAPGTYEFKIVKNGSTWIPDGANKTIQITEEASYDFTFTYNPSNDAITGTAVKVGSAHIEMVYHVVGSSPAIWPSGTWGDGIGKDENKLEKTTDENGTVCYAKTYENVELTPGTIEFKFIINGDWEPNSNRTFNITASGTYNVTFTYWPSDSYGEGVATPVGEVQPLVISVMSITGELTGGWTNQDWSDNNWKDMTQDSGNPAIWTLVVEGFEAEARTYEYKAAANHNWIEYTLPNEGNNDYYFSEPGIYTLKFVVDTENHDLTLDVEKTGSIVEPDPSLFILGEANDNGWAPNVGVEMSYDGVQFSAENIAFKGNNDEGASYFSFTKKLAESADDWDGIANYRIGAVTDGGAFWLTDEWLGPELSLQAGDIAFRATPGIYKLSVNLNTMKLVIVKTADLEPTAIETVEVETANNVYYNLQGQRVAAPTKGIYINNGRKVIVK